MSTRNPPARAKYWGQIIRMISNSATSRSMSARVTSSPARSFPGGGSITVCATIGAEILQMSCHIRLLVSSPTSAQEADLAVRLLAVLATLRDVGESLGENSEDSSFATRAVAYSPRFREPFDSRLSYTRGRCMRGTIAIGIAGRKGLSALIRYGFDDCQTGCGGAI